MCVKKATIDENLLTNLSPVIQIVHITVHWRSIIKSET